MKFILGFLMILMTACQPVFGAAVVFSGNDVKTLKSIIDINGNAKILSGSVNPSSSATSAPRGSIYLNTSTNALYVKTDAGSSTNWIRFDNGLTNPMTTTGDIIYSSDNSGTPARLAASNGTLISTSGVLSYAAHAPTVQRFTSGSGTYTTPAGVKWIRVRMVGGGGGGGGSGNSGTGGAGGAGGNTTFGTSLLVANGGGGGGGTASAPGAGGSASLGTGPIGTALTGGRGQGGGGNGTNNFTAGGSGASTPFGGAGGGGEPSTGGYSAITNSGSGGGGGGSGSANYSGSGGGGGGFVDAIISSPSSSYSYAVGSAGAAGTAGTGTAATGGSGGSGVIIVEEYYH